MKSNLSPLNELLELKEEIILLRENLNVLDSSDTRNFTFGDRVELTNSNPKSEGRVWGWNNYGEVQVNMDNRENYMNCDPRLLKNLSVGTYGKMEKSLWLKQMEVKSVLEKMKESAESIEWGVDRLSTVQVDFKVLNLVLIPDTNIYLLTIQKRGEVRRIVTFNKLINQMIVDKSYKAFFASGCLKRLEPIP